jgi:hypothetical protein
MFKWPSRYINRRVGTSETGNITGAKVLFLSGTYPLYTPEIGVVNKHKIGETVNSSSVGFSQADMNGRIPVKWAI